MGEAPLDTPSQPRKGRKKSRPKVTPVVDDAILLGEGDPFLLEGHAALVLLPVVTCSLAPPGLAGIYTIPSPTAYAVGYGLSPAMRASQCIETLM